MSRLGRSRPARSYGRARPASPVGLSSGTLSLKPLAVSGSAGISENATGTIALPRLAVSGTAFWGYPFPVHPLNLLVEILLNGTWTDITDFVYQRNPMTISRGRPNETTSVQASQVTITLDNRTGRFTPGNVLGAYYPYVTRNVQLRISVQNALSSDASSLFTGYRFWGEVSAWPPSWDPTGSDVYVQITASGALRRYQQGAAIGSALRRYYARLTGDVVPYAIWPCEDGSTATVIASLLPSVDAMTFTGAPQFASNSSFGGSDALPDVNSSSWHGVTGADSTPPGTGSITQTTPGTYSFTPPPGVTSVSVDELVGGSGAGGAANATTGGGGGGGAEQASNSGVAVTAGNPYTYIVPAGGSATSGDGGDGGNATWTGDSHTAIAHGGKGGKQTGTGGAGGTGSSDTTHHNGGAGGTGQASTTSSRSASLNGFTGARGGGTGAGGTQQSQPWVCPAGTTSVVVDQVFAAGGGGAGGSAGAGAGAGGGGESSGTITTTPGNTYTFNAGNGGNGGSSGSSGDSGGDSGVTGDSGSVTSGGGTGGASDGTPGAGGSGDFTGGDGGTQQGGGSPFGSGGTEHDGEDGDSGGISGGGLWPTRPDGAAGGGGAGGGAGAAGGGGGGGSIQWHWSQANAPSGGGGGSSGGTSSAGNAGGNDGTGGSAVTGGGAGGNQGTSGAVPGGGGGGGVPAFGSTAAQAPGNGAAGKVSFSWNGGATSPVAADIVRFLLDVPVGGEPDGTVLVRILTYSTDVARLDVLYHTGGNLELKGYDSGSSSKFDSGSHSFGADGTPMLVEVRLTGSGSNINWSFSAIEPGAGSAIATYTGTVTGTVEFVSDVFVSPDSDVADSAVGWITAQTYADPLTTLASVINGYAGELAADRLSRLAGEEGLSFTLVGSSADTPQMGPQQDDKLVAILQSCEDMDRGQLYEPRDSFGIAYRTRVSMQNQSPDLIADYTAGVLAQGLQPTADDQYTRNDITVSRAGGSAVTVMLTTGVMSTQSPPNGVGDYTYSPSVIAFADTQLSGLAQWLLDLGTVDELRYPQISFDQARAEVAALFDDIADLDVGDFIQITKPPQFLTSSNVNQLAWGFSEVLNAFTWTISVNGVPEDPYSGSDLPTW